MDRRGHQNAFIKLQEVKELKTQEQVAVAKTNYPFGRKPPSGW
jgi:hypothetical protein